MSEVRRGFCFIMAGGLAFLVDVGVLSLLIVVGVPALVARLISISLAVVCGWLLNRTLTFEVREAPTLVEFLRYNVLAWAVAALNYGIFAGLLAFELVRQPALATAASSVLAMGASYAGMRFGVFRQTE